MKRSYESNKKVEESTVDERSFKGICQYETDSESETDNSVPSKKRRDNCTRMKRLEDDSKMPGHGRRMRSIGMNNCLNKVYATIKDQKEFLRIPILLLNTTKWLRTEDMRMRSTSLPIIIIIMLENKKRHKNISKWLLNRVIKKLNGSWKTWSGLWITAVLTYNVRMHINFLIVTVTSCNVFMAQHHVILKSDRQETFLFAFTVTGISITCNSHCCRSTVIIIFFIYNSYTSS